MTGVGFYRRDVELLPVQLHTTRRQLCLPHSCKPLFTTSPQSSGRNLILSQDEGFADSNLDLKLFDLVDFREVLLHTQYNKAKALWLMLVQLTVSSDSSFVNDGDERVRAGRPLPRGTECCNKNQVQS